ncbi:MAG: hypothetical protein J2P56_06735, partial [Verrucomicrobia bacterium]|nr:hypothetical protein [Verrucomicrobiota bacterium]
MAHRSRSVWADAKGAAAASDFPDFRKPSRCSDDNPESTHAGAGAATAREFGIGRLATTGNLSTSANLLGTADFEFVAPTYVFEVVANVTYQRWSANRSAIPPQSHHDSV